MYRKKLRVEVKDPAREIEREIERERYKESSDKAQRTKIETGERQSGMVHVTAGLNPRDKVVTAGQIFQLLEG